MEQGAVTRSSTRFAVGSVQVDALQLPDAVALLISAERPRTVHLCNAYTVALAERDPVLRDCLSVSELNLADGYPIAWVARRRGLRHMKERASGPDLMRECLDSGRATGVRHFLYGSTPEVIASMVEHIQGRWPGTQVVGAESPPFRETTEADRRAAAERFEHCGADIVWVGLGTPKQDFEVERLSKVSSATFVAIGAAFDFIAGTKRQPPRWVRRCGLEWAFRLATEPRRLWRRYLVGIPRFLRIVWRKW